MPADSTAAAAGCQAFEAMLKRSAPLADKRMMTRLASFVDSHRTMPAASRPVDIDAFLFDVDGVLADTAGLHTAAWADVALEIGQPFPQAVAQLLRGRSREDSLRLILSGRRLSDDEFAAVMDRKNERYVQSLARLTPADGMPGVADLLTDLASMGIALAAVSASRNAMSVLERIGIRDLFRAIVDGNVSTEKAGGSNRYQLAAESLGCDPKRCVVVEDSQAGIELARSAGMRSVGIGCSKRLAMADTVVAAFHDVRAVDLLSALGMPALVGVTNP